MTDYQKYRGKCKEYVTSFCEQNSNYLPVRGYYICPIWGKQAHWWCKDRNTGEIIDPTVKQFPSARMGEYIEYDGYVECAECGKRVHESEASFESNYAFCSGKCHGRFVGVY